VFEGTRTVIIRASGAAVVDSLVRDGGLSIFMARGEITAAQLLAAYDDFLRRGPTRLVLWDVTNASVSGIQVEDVRAFVGQLAQRVTAHSNHEKTAIVCGNDVTFGIARMLGTSLEIEGFPGTIRAFRDLRTARAWLAEEGTRP
jgi:hypothetical protein